MLHVFNDLVFLVFFIITFFSNIKKIGYQTFLYPSFKDFRIFILFVVFVSVCFLNKFFITDWIHALHLIGYGFFGLFLARIFLGSIPMNIVLRVDAHTFFDYDQVMGDRNQQLVALRKFLEHWHRPRQPEHSLPRQVRDDVGRYNPASRRWERKQW